MDPVPWMPASSSSPSSSKKGTPQRKRRINSGLVKLTCPRLVRAVDQLEDEGMIQQYNTRLKLTPTTTTTTSSEDDDTDTHEEEDVSIDVMVLRESIRQSHLAHATARRNILHHRPTTTTTNNNTSDIDTTVNNNNDDDNNDSLSFVLKTLGPKGTQAFLNAGVAGATPLPPVSSSDIDVKCLHAWLADYLFRGGVTDGDVGESGGGVENSMMGALVARQLESLLEDDDEDGIGGTMGCHVLCDPTSTSGMAEPPKPRNKQRLKGRKEKERKQRRRQLEDDGGELGVMGVVPKGSNSKLAP